MKSIVTVLLALSLVACGAAPSLEPASHEDPALVTSPVVPVIAECAAWNAANPDVQVGTAKAYRYTEACPTGSTSTWCQWTPIDGSPLYDATTFVGCKTVQTASTGLWDLQCCP